MDFGALHRVSELMMRHELIHSQMSLTNAIEKSNQAKLAAQAEIPMTTAEHQSSGCAEEYKSDLYYEEQQAPVGNEEQQALEHNKEQPTSEDQVENNEETSDFALVHYTHAQAEDHTQFSQAATDSPTISDSSFIHDNLIKNTRTHYPSLGEPVADAHPRPAEKPGKPEWHTNNQIAPEGKGQPRLLELRTGGRD
ncbi:nitrate transporter [Dorcoceras hygrometricum]|uniref:Nitrate transporter n=1 Tax=Dorcoceras hygrometricum TaxID=472368 RepID=A0A2Z7C4P1_9LAMI|nr:nitrate transporter [Dorcoceras hygrometricum]